MADEILTFQEVFNDAREPHRIIAVSESKVVEYQTFRKDVYILYSKITQNYRPHVYINIQSPGYFLVAVLACAFAHRDIYNVSTLSQESIEELVESDDLFFTDIDDFSVSKCMVINIHELVGEHYDSVGDFAMPTIDSENVTHYLLVEAPNHTIIRNPLSIHSMEKLIHAMLKTFPDIEPGTVFCYTDKLSFGFYLIFGALLSFLKRGIIYLPRIKTQNSLINLLTHPYVLITSYDFIKTINTETTIPRATFVAFLGRVINQQTILHASQIFHSQLVQYIGTARSFCYAYRSPIKSNLIHLLDGIEYKLDKNNVLVLTKNIVREEEYNTNLIVKPKHNGFELVGDAQRLIFVDGQKFFLDEVEKYALGMEHIKNAAALAIKDDKRNAKDACVCLAIELEDNYKNSFNENRERTNFIIGIRSDLETVLPSQLVPRKVRLIEKMPYNKSGMINYDNLVENFVTA
ncbi:MAG: hypothetical protein SPK04_06750 [Succinivibrionaceae bacterium]|nr:hypothetical protein [Succinivibrionaceae bacterium]